MFRPLLLVPWPPLHNNIRLPHTLLRIPLHACTNIALKRPRLHPVLKHLMYLLQRAIPRLRNKEDGEQDEEGIGAEPDVAVLGAPVELRRVDEVGRCEGAQPVANEV